MKRWQKWYLATITTLAAVFAATTFAFYFKAIPFPDLGHRAYGVPDSRAALIVEEVLVHFLGEPFMRFDAGPTHQTVFKDGTVILWLDKEFKENYHLSSSAISLVCDDPGRAADSLVKFFQRSGYSASWFDVADWEMPGEKPFPLNNLTIISTSAIEDQLVLRRHFLDMPEPKKRKK